MYFRLNGISFKLQAYFYNLMSLLENPSQRWGHLPDAGWGRPL